MPIVVQCNSCKKKIKAAEKFAGKRVKCPGCQSVLAIPSADGTAAAPAAVKPTAPAPTAGLLDDEIPIRQEASQPAVSPLAGMLDDDIPIRQEAAVPAAAQTPASCPGCGTAVQTGAVICVDCGYDFRAQTKRSQQIGDGDGSGGKKKKKKKKRELFGGHSTQVMQLVRGCIFSFIGACIGAFIWYWVAKLTGRQSIWIAWGLGGMAGMGMAAGYGHEEMFGGICAGVIAFLGICVAKLAIFFWILGPLFMIMLDMGPDDGPGEEFTDDEFVEAEEFPGEPQEDVGEEDEEGEEYADENDYADEEEEMGSGEVVVFGMSLFFKIMFGFYDLILIPLACVTAFKIGSSGSTSGD
jgi:phage FluMu protein Com